MKSFKMFSMMTVFLLLFGVVGVASADNATQVSVEISYPYGQDVAVSDAAAGDSVNVYVTLKDASGAPATAGPAGETLSSVTATLSTTLGLAGAITANSFVADALQINFDTPTGSGPAARGQVNYTGSDPGVDQLIVSVPLDPDPIIGTADVRVVASDAQSLVARTYRNGSPSSVIYTLIDPQQFNGGGATETAGTAVPFWVIANDSPLGIGVPNYTFAPNIEGQVVTVLAWADFNGNGQIDATGPEATPIGTGTATFVNGIAQGTVTINNGSPFTGAPLIVALTASVVDDAGATIQTNQTLPVPAGDFSVDLVPMLSQANAAKLLIGGIPPVSDPYGGFLIVPLSNCEAILDDNTVPTTLTVFLADSLGNAVLAPAPVIVGASLGAGSTLETHPIWDTSGAPPAALSPAWDIPPGSYLTVDFLQDNSGAANDALTVVPGTLTLTAPGLMQAQAALNLLPSNGIGVINMSVATDADDLGATLAAGSTIEITIGDPAAAGYLPIVNGDTLEITANTGPNGPQLLSTVAGGFASASTTLIVPAIDENPATTPDIELSVVIYGPATTTPGEQVVVQVADQSRCGVAADNAATDIDDIDPGPGQFLEITGVDGQTADDLTADPVVITSPIVADGATLEDILDGDGTTNEAQEIDEFGNVTDAAPNFAASPVNGLCVLGVDPTDTAPADGTILTANCVAAAVGQTETIALTTTPAGLTRDIQLSTIVASATGPTGVATDLVELQEGPTDVDGMMIDPEAGGEAIFRVSANGSGTINRNIQIDFGEGTVEGAELRSLNGTMLTTPYTATLNFVPTLQDIRLVVAAPTAGCVTLVATDLSGTPLNPGTLDIGFDAPCGVPDCEVTLDPANPTVVAGGTVDFAASTSCGGVVQELAVAPVFTWSITATDCTGSASTIDATGMYTASDTGGCTETVTATDTANGDVTADAIVTVTDTAPTVTVTPAAVQLAPGETQTFSAATTSDGSPLMGSYTWSVAGGTADSTTGDSIVYTAGTVPGTYTITATDTANGDVQGTAEVIVGQLCSVTPVKDTYAKSHWTFLPVLIRLQTTGIEGLAQSTQVTFDCASPLSVIKLIKLVNAGTGIINQFALISPAILTGNFQDDTETCTVTVAGCEQTAEITLNIQSLGIIPLGE